MDIKPDNLNGFRSDFDKTMKTLEEKYDVTIHLGCITYSRNQFHATLSVDNGRDPERIAENRFDEDVLDYPETGLRPGMYRQVFVASDGRKYAVIGFRRNAKKYPIEAVDIRTGEYQNGSVHFIKEVLNEKYLDNLADFNDVDKDG